MSSMYRYLAMAVVITSVIFISRPCFALELGGPPNPVGSGARAMGMGGAFIAVADDATAASWNPAGLVQLERPEVSVVGIWMDRLEDVRAHVHPELDGMNPTDTWDLNYLSIVYPFTVWDRNVTVSLNHQRLYDMNKDYHGRLDYLFDLDENMDNGWEFGILNDNFFEQRGGLTTVSPAIAFQVTPDLSLGFTYNFWINPFEDNGWVSYSYVDYEHLFDLHDGPPLVLESGVNATRDDYDFYGTNFNAGIMYYVTPNLVVAGVYKDGFRARLRRHRTTIDTSEFSLTPIVYEKDYLELTMPRSYGVGVSYRYSDVLTFALDVYRTEWSGFIQNDDGEQRRPSIGKRQSDTVVAETYIPGSTMKATTQVRAGMEYLIIMPTYVIPLRLGGFYDPEPSERNPNDFFGFSVGTGIAIDPFAFDIAYTYRTGDSTELLLGAPSSTDSYLEQHQVIFSLIYYLDWLDFGG